MHTTACPPPDPPLLAIGLCLAEEALPSPKDPVPVHTPTATPPFVHNIMHRPVPPRPFLAHVQYETSVASLAAAFHLPEPHIQALWLPSPTTCLPPVCRGMTKRAASRFTPQSVQDASPALSSVTYPLSTTAITSSSSITTLSTTTASSSNSTSLSAAATLTAARRKARRAGLPARFASLFAPAGTTDERTLHFATALAGRLRTLVQTPKTDTDSGPRSAPSPPPGTAANALSPPPAHPAPPACGLSVRRTHSDVALLCARRAARKERAGLYRSAGSEAEVARGGCLQWRYFELVVVDDCVAGGICIGVCTEALPLNRMVGGDGRSVALHSSGQVVRAGGRFMNHGRGFGNGDRVGCAVRSTEDANGVEVIFFVNGERQGNAVTEPLWDGVPDDDRVAHMGVSLYKKDSKVVLLCCDADWRVEMETLRREVGDVESMCGGLGEEDNDDGELLQICEDDDVEMGL